MATIDSTPNTPQQWRACELCGAVQSHTRLIANGYHIVECEICGLVFVGEEVTRGDLDEYYSKAYYSGGANAYDDYLSLGDSRRMHYRSLMPSLRRNLPHTTPIRVLDVGCAAGFFMDVAKEVGWEPSGVELSPYMSRVARERGLDVRVGSLEEVDLPRESFHLVTMWDMIEHAQHPRAVLERAHELLAPGGLLVAATGDIGGLTARVYGRRWGLIAPPGHLFYFSRRSFFSMLDKTGFTPLEWQSDGAFLINDCDAQMRAGILSRLAVRLQQSRPGNAVLRRLKLGSIMTVFARKAK